jgi:hypothetical protein
MKTKFKISSPVKEISELQFVILTNSCRQCSKFAAEDHVLLLKNKDKFYTNALRSGKTERALRYGLPIGPDTIRTEIENLYIRNAYSMFKLIKCLHRMDEITKEQMAIHLNWLEDWRQARNDIQEIESSIRSLKQQGILLTADQMCQIGKIKEKHIG